jgi:peptide maturation system protein (TIGR04066 family)
MRKALIYPYDAEFAPVLRHRSLLKDFKIMNVISPKGWGYVGKDAGMADGGHKMGLTVKEDFENALEDCDTVLLADSDNDLDFKKFILPKIATASKKGASIFCARRLDSTQRIEAENCCRENGSSFVCLYGQSSVHEQNEIKENLMQISVPVVFVLGTGERTDKFEIQLSLREELLKSDYNVSQIGSRAYCELLGFHSMPEFMMDAGLHESKKIAGFNHFIKRIELKEKPDLIVIGIPGGIMAIDNNFTNHFGILTFEISQALEPDFVILSSLYENYKAGYFDNISDGIAKRFGYPVNCHILAHTKIDWQQSQDGSDLSYLSLNSDFLTKKIKDYSNIDSTVLNIYDRNGLIRLAGIMLDKLSANAYATPI